MINAFGLCRSLATAHEGLIGIEMLKHERRLGIATTSKKRALGNYKTGSYDGFTPDRRARIDQEWLDRAKILREFLENHPGATMVEIIAGIGEDKHTVQSWLLKMRAKPKYGIKGKKHHKAKSQFIYWRAEDTLPFEG